MHHHQNLSYIFVMRTKSISHPYYQEFSFTLLQEEVLQKLSTLNKLASRWKFYWLYRFQQVINIHVKALLLLIVIY